jgi:hypothetical protein
MPPVVLPDMPAEPETAPLPPVLVIPPFPLGSGVVSDPHALASRVTGRRQAAGANQRRDRCIKKFSPYDMVSARRGSRLTDVTPKEKIYPLVRVSLEFNAGDHLS